MHQWLKDSCFSSDNNIFISDIKVLWFKIWLCSVLVQTFFRIMHNYLFVCCPCPWNHCFVCVSCIIIIITNIATDHGCYLSIQLALNANHLFQERVLYKQRIYFFYFFSPHCKAITSQPRDWSVQCWSWTNIITIMQTQHNTGILGIPLLCRVYSKNKIKGYPCIKTVVN